MSKMSPEENLVTIDEAAKLLDVSVRTVARLQSDGVLPPVYRQVTVRGDRRRYYRAADIEQLRDSVQASA